MNQLQTIADEITAVYPEGQFEPGTDSLTAKVVGPTGAFVLSHAADNFYVVRVVNGKPKVHHYNPASDQRIERLHDFVGLYV
jgi:hypothetical protein